MLTLKDVESVIHAQGVNRRSFSIGLRNYRKWFQDVSLDPEDVLPLMICDVLQGRHFATSAQKAIDHKVRTVALEEDTREASERAPGALEEIRGALSRISPPDRSWALLRVHDKLLGPARDPGRKRAQCVRFIWGLGLETSAG